MTWALHGSWKKHIFHWKMLFIAVFWICSIYMGSHGFSRLFMYHKKALISGGKKCALCLHSITPPLILLMDGTPRTLHSTLEHRTQAECRQACWQDVGYLLIEEGKQISHHDKDRPGQGQEQFADVKRSLIEIIYSCRTEGDKVRGPPGHI